jgi:membrane-associated phospholipid phosphatase
VEPSPLADRLRRATDVVLGLYLVATAALIVAFRASLPSWKTLLALHAAAAFVLRSLPGSGRAPWPFLALLRDWYPVIAFPVLYKEVELFAAAFGDWRLTGPLRHLEATLFAGQPSLYLSETLVSVPLSEYLHFCYFAYVLLVPVIGGTWYFKGKRTAFHELVFLVSLAYASSYLFYSLFPVDSPFYLSPPLGPPFEGHFFYDLVHFLSQQGGARGGAFPSSHVSVATVVLLVTMRRERRWLFWLLPIYAGLVFATVFGRFHYAVDVLAGWALAVFLCSVSWARRRSSTGEATDAR